MRRFSSWPALLAAVALVAAACGGGDDSDPGGDDPAPLEDSSGAVSSLGDVESATIQIVSRGTFAEPAGNLASYEEFSGVGNGSGFIIDSEGIAVTNNHVVTGAATLDVFVGGDDEPVSARVLGVSECADLAVIDIEGDGFPFLKWSDDPATVGLEVRAAGFPLGDPEYTLTSGIVSKAEADGDTEWASVDGVIEHDANIQPGNSGGPLVTLDGEVVGVNYAGGDPGTGTSQFFAIAPDLAVPLVEDLRDGDVLSLGINGQAVVDDELGIAGVWVSSVDTDSPAGDVGLRGGDVVLSLEGLPVGGDGTLKDYCDVLRSHDAADKLAVEALRFETNEVLEGQFNGDELAVYAPIFDAAQDAGVADDVAAGGGSEGQGTYTSYVSVTDDSETITMDVPTEWAEVLGEPLVLDDGSEVGPQLIVSPDLEAYFETFDVPGVEFVATSDPSFDVPTMLEAIGPSEFCVSTGREAYDDGFFVGEIEFWEECGGVGAVVVTLAAHSNADPDVLAVLFGQIVSEADFDAMDRVLATFDVLI